MSRVAFSEDGKTLIVNCADGRVRVLPFPVSDSAPADRLRLDIEVLTGTEEGEDEEPVVLAPEEWKSRRRQLRGATD